MTKLEIGRSQVSAFPALHKVTLALRTLLSALRVTSEILPRPVVSGCVVLLNQNYVTDREVVFEFLPLRSAVKVLQILSFPSDPTDRPGTVWCKLKEWYKVRSTWRGTKCLSLAIIPIVNVLLVRLQTAAKFGEEDIDKLQDFADVCADVNMQSVGFTSSTWVPELPNRDRPYCRELTPFSSLEMGEADSTVCREIRRCLS